MEINLTQKDNEIINRTNAKVFYGEHSDSYMILGKMGDGIDKKYIPTNIEGCTPWIAKTTVFGHNAWFCETICDYGVVGMSPDCFEDAL